MKSHAVLGIDPGKNTGYAVYRNRELIEIGSMTDYKFYEWFREHGDQFDIIALEDSRKQRHVWSASKASGAAAVKIGRDLGRLDHQCHMIQSLCYERDWDLRLHSPLSTGTKLNEKEFREVTGWDGPRGNQHARDAAMVARMHRHPEAERREEERKKLGLR